MRVLVLTHVFPRAVDDPLGAFLLHLAQALAASPAHAEVRVLAPHAAGLADHESLGPIPVTRFHYAGDAGETLAYTGRMHEQVARGVTAKLAFARFLAAYTRGALAAARAWRPDVIHAHWWLPGGLAGAVVSRLTQIPLVITTHGTDVEQLRSAPGFRPLARRVLGRARVVTCGSTYLREQLLALQVDDGARVRVLPMPVNPLFLKPIARAPSPGFVILTVARLTAQKNIALLLDALALLRAGGDGAGVNARVRIAGDGPERGALEAHARALGLAPFVEFSGMLPQAALPPLYAACSAFVLPSVREGMGLVLAEALACGAPVIASAPGGVTDIVRAGETGLLFPERDAPALARALERYARDPQYAAALADQGRAHVLNCYTPASVAAQFASLYAAL